MRGRAIALWQVAFQGTTPIGGPAVGWIIALSGARAGLAAGGVACLVAGAGGLLLARRAGRSDRSQETGQPQVEDCRAA
jgi:MFS family permease